MIPRRAPGRIGQACVAGMLLAAASLVSGQTAPNSDVDALVAQLGHEQYRVRENAFRQILQARPEWLPALEAAAKQATGEVAARLSTHLPAIRGNIACKVVRQERQAALETLRQQLWEASAPARQEDPELERQLKMLLPEADFSLERRRVSMARPRNWSQVHNHPILPLAPLPEESRRMLSTWTEKQAINQYLGLLLVDTHLSREAHRSDRGGMLPLLEIAIGQVDEKYPALWTYACGQYVTCRMMLDLAQVNQSDRNVSGLEFSPAFRARYLKALEKLWTDPKMPRSLVRALTLEYLNTCLPKYPATTREAEIKSLFTELTRVLGPNDALPHQLRGRAYLEQVMWAYAHPPRSAEGDLVPAYFKLRPLAERGRFRAPEFHAQIARWRGEAAASLEEARKRDRRDAAVRGDLLLLEYYTLPRHGERFEQRFQDALAADPDSLAACELKLWMLAADAEAEEKMLAFVRQLAQQPYGRVETRFLARPLLLNPQYRSSARCQNLSDEQLWAILQPTYQAYLTEYPDDHLRRSEYVQAAAHCQAWEIVREQLRLLGNNVVIKVFTDSATLELLRKRAASAEQTPAN